jgi:hypothetical protein
LITFDIACSGKYPAPLRNLGNTKPIVLSWSNGTLLLYLRQAVTELSLGKRLSEPKLAQDGNVTFPHAPDLELAAWQSGVVWPIDID